MNKLMAHAALLETQPLCDCAKTKRKGPGHNSTSKTTKSVLVALAWHWTPQHKPTILDVTSQLLTPPCTYASFTGGPYRTPCMHSIHTYT